MTSWDDYINLFCRKRYIQKNWTHFRVQNLKAGSTTANFHSCSNWICLYKQIVHDSNDHTYMYLWSIIYFFLSLSLSLFGRPRCFSSSCIWFDTIICNHLQLSKSRSRDNSRDLDLLLWQDELVICTNSLEMHKTACSYMKLRNGRHTTITCT